MKLEEWLAAAGIAVVAFLFYLGYNVLPVLFLAGILVILYQAMGARGWQRRLVPIHNSGYIPHVSFDDIGGQETAKKELLEALDFVHNEERLKRLGIRPLKGILLTGPPGTGKTLMAKAAASYTNSVFLAASGSEFIEVYAGVGAQRVRELFNKARQYARAEKKKSAIIFIDEIEVLGGQRGKHSSHLEYDQCLNQLLVEMDGLSLDDEVKILVVGATNRIDLLDPAILRPGRFDRIVWVHLPDREGRLHILKVHTRNKPLAPGSDLDRVARETFGFSGAHLESVANEAAILALREGKEQIEQRHFMEAIDKVIMGEKLERRPRKEELERVAVHESGHALVAEIIRPGSVSSVTITSRGSALGYVRQVPEDDSYLYTRAVLEEQIRLLLAGAVAEEEVLGSRSTGAANDFEKAVGLARRIVLAGLSGLGVVDPDSLPVEALHRTIKDILDRQEAWVREKVTARKEYLRSVAAILVDTESVSGDEFRCGLETGRIRGKGYRQPRKLAGRSSSSAAIRCFGREIGGEIGREIGGERRRVPCPAGE